MTHPDIVAARIDEAYRYVANVVLEHGTGEYADKLRAVLDAEQGPGSREMAQAFAVAGAVEMFVDHLQGPKTSSAKRKKTAA